MPSSRSSYQSGGLRFVCLAILGSMPQLRRWETVMQSCGTRVSCIKEPLYNNLPCLTSHLSFGQYIDCSCSFSCLLAEELAPTPFMLIVPEGTRLLQNNSNSQILRPKFRPSSTCIMGSHGPTPSCKTKRSNCPVQFMLKTRSIHYARIIRDI
jgi:hypothetical protein